MIKNQTLDSFKGISDDDKVRIMRSHKAKRPQDLEFKGYSSNGNMMWGKTQEIVNKAIAYHSAMEKGKQNKKAINMASWTEQDHSNWDRLLVIREFYLKGKRDLEFVAVTLHDSVMEWGKPLSVKQMDSVVKAELKINVNGQ
jgi:hypothetical protein